MGSRLDDGKVPSALEAQCDLECIERIVRLRFKKYQSYEVCLT